LRKTYPSYDAFFVLQSDSQKINEIEEKDMLKEEDEENEDEGYEPGQFMLERPSGKEK